MNEQESSFAKALRQLLFGEKDAGFEDDREKIKGANRETYWKNPWNKLAMITFLKDKGIQSDYNNVRQKYADYVWREYHYGDGSIPTKKAQNVISLPKISDTYKEAQ